MIIAAVLKESFGAIKQGVKIRHCSNNGVRVVKCNVDKYHVASNNPFTAKSAILFILYSSIKDNYYIQLY